MTRSGILAAGNFIIDHVKQIEAWPEQDMLASILSETSSNGGGPYNVLKDLAAMGADYPLEACGLVGEDANGKWIREDCARAGIATQQLQSTNEAPTSYTDAMTVVETGRRTFFHQRGANALFNESHIACDQSSAKLFHLGYLMLLDSMDSLRDDGRTRASLALEAAKGAGMITSVDIVSTENPSFREIAECALPHIDLLVINELEAGRIVDRELKPSDSIKDCEDAAGELLGLGVRQEVVIHFVEGAVAASANGSGVYQPSLSVPSEAIAGATGAGDAFAAGYLHGKHEGWETGRCLQLGVCTAAACLADPTASGGLQPVADCLDLADRFGYRS